VALNLHRFLFESVFWDELMHRLNLAKLGLGAAGALALFLTAQPGYAATDYTSRSLFPGDDSLDWSQLGAAFTNVGNSPTATSVNGIVVTVTQPGGGDFERRDEGNGWGGIFSPGEALLWNQDNSGEMDFAFSTAISGFGVNIQEDDFGTFQILETALNGATTILTCAGSGNNNAIEGAGQGGDAPFCGITDALADITNIEITTQDGGDFAIDSLALQDTPEATIPTPEPASGLLVSGALLMFGAWRRRKRA
jgi:hypothetical protein